MPLASKLSSLSLLVLMGPGLTALNGCDQKKTPAQASSTPASHIPISDTQPALVAPGTTPPTTGPTTGPSTQPANTYLVINDKLEEFPDVRVRVLRSDDQVTVVLYTADPETAINNDYQGNSYYLTMPLTDVKDVPGALVGSWRFKSGTSDHEDTTEGIFLKGLRTHLQANDVLVRVEQTADGYLIRLAGQFLAFDTTNLQMPGVLTNVAGEITATTESKKH